MLTASDSAGDTTWTSAGAVSGWTISGNNVYETLGGNVGIGTTTVNQGALVVTNGNVGIGTWAPNAPLSFGGSTGEKIRLFDSGTAASTNGFGIAPNDFQSFIGPSSNFFTWRQNGYNGTTLMVLSGVGNVGIGSVAPGTALDVTGTVRATGFTMSGQTPISGYVLTASDSAGDTTWTSAGAVSGWTISGNNVYETLGGNVGIGTTTVNQAAFVVTNGNVGIGTWAPSTQLAVQQSPTSYLTYNGSTLDVRKDNAGALGPVLQLDNDANAANDEATIQFQDAGQIRNQLEILSPAGGGGRTDLIFNAYPGGAYALVENMRIRGDGEVGIGTSTPGSLLSVLGGASFGSYATTAAPSGGIIASGNVGIGSAAPGHRSTVRGTVRTTGFTMSGQTPIAGYVLTASDSAGDTSWASLGAAGGWTVASGSDVYETGSGNVGLGSLSPGQKLDVQGTVRADYFMGNGSLLSGLTSSQWLTVNVNDVYLPNNGKVGLGTNLTSTATLSVMSGNVGIGTWVPGKSLVLEQKSTTDGFQFTGTSIANNNTGTGFLTALGFNMPNNKQLWLGDIDYEGIINRVLPTVSGSFNGIPYFDVVRGDGAAFGPIEIGTGAGSPVAVDAPAGTALSLGKLFSGLTVMPLLEMVTNQLFLRRSMG